MFSPSFENVKKCESVRRMQEKQHEKYTRDTNYHPFSHGSID